MDSTMFMIDPKMQDAFRLFVYMAGLVSVGGLGVFLKEVISTITKIYFSKKEKGDGENFRRRSDFELQRLADASEKMANMVDKVADAQTIMATVLDRQQKFIENFIDRQREMEFKLNKIYETQVLRKH